MKNGKRILAALLVLTMVFALAACSLGGPKPGSYKLTGMTADGKDYSDVVGLLNIKLVLNRDHTGYLSLSGDQTSIKWNNKSVVNGDVTISMTYSGNTVTLSNNGTTMVFTREG